jgi:type IV pilus assembly protein PilQ
MTRAFPAACLALTFGSLPASAARAKSPERGRALEIGRSAPRYRGAPISLDLKNADLKDLLLSFAKVATANIVVDPDVRGSVTARLTDVPWDQAMDLIVQMSGYAWVRDGRIVRIGSAARLR